MSSFFLSVCGKFLRTAQRLLLKKSESTDWKIGKNRTGFFRAVFRALFKGLSVKAGHKSHEILQTNFYRSRAKSRELSQDPRKWRRLPERRVRASSKGSGG